MLRSLYSGVSGLRNFQTRMDVIGNNIANVNTIGFKSSDAYFKDIYSQTISPASGPTNGKGGVNPQQVGLGSTIGTITVNFTGVTGAYRTEAPLDVMVEGNGFFTIKKSDTDTDTIYTRVGNFYTDKDGNLCTSEGYRVQGKLPDGTTGSITIPAADLDQVASVTIKEDGVVEVLKGDGTTVNIGTVLITTFVNDNGLQKVGNSYYRATSNSGAAVADVPGGANGAGYLNPGALEMSNVDLGREFSNMIVTQRGFQANSRIITTSDQMLEELVNMKR